MRPDIETSLTAEYLFGTLCGMLATTHRIHKFLQDEWDLPYSPTVAEIAAGVGHSPSTVHAHLQILVEKGLVSWTGKARTIALIEEKAS